jgi:hypothetical protein
LFRDRWLQSRLHNHISELRDEDVLPQLEYMTQEFSTR